MVEGIEGKSTPVWGNFLGLGITETRCEKLLEFNPNSRNCPGFPAWISGLLIRKFPPTQVQSTGILFRSSREECQR